jgi:hypothetical protein
MMPEARLGTLVFILRIKARLSHANFWRRLVHRCLAIIVQSAYPIPLFFERQSKIQTRLKLLGSDGN